MIKHEGQPEMINDKITCATVWEKFVADKIVQKLAVY